MTDEAFEELRAFCQRVAWPPSELFPLGIGVPLVVDRELAAEDSPMIKRGLRVGDCEVRVTPDDYVDLRRRCDRLERELPTWSTSAGLRPRRIPPPDIKPA